MQSREIAFRHSSIIEIRDKAFSAVYDAMLYMQCSAVHILTSIEIFEKNFETFFGLLFLGFISDAVFLL